MSTAVAANSVPSIGTALPAPPREGPIVIKFGGTSLATPARVRRAAARVSQLRRAGRRLVVVVSAAGHTTDRILRRAASIHRGQAPVGDEARRELDRALATGEDRSAALLAVALLAAGVPAVSLRGGEAGIRAAGEFGAGRPVTLHAGRVRALLAQGRVPVITGYQGERADGETVTLGRGGSDLSAVFLAVQLGAAECRIVTDVDGVYSADPNHDPAATRFDRLTHEALVAITGAGAVVVHPDAARRAAAAALPLRVHHHSAPLRGDQGTLIVTDDRGRRCGR